MLQYGGTFSLSSRPQSRNAAFDLLYTAACIA
jgi:hypothetical protein